MTADIELQLLTETDKEAYTEINGNISYDNCIFNTLMVEKISLQCDSEVVDEVTDASNRTSALLYLNHFLHFPFCTLNFDVIQQNKTKKIHLFK